MKLKPTKAPLIDFYAIAKPQPVHMKRKRKKNSARDVGMCFLWPERKASSAIKRGASMSPSGIRVAHLPPEPREGCRQGRSVWNTSSVNMDESRLPICCKNL